MTIRRPWTAEEDEKVRSAASEQTSYVALARRLGRTLESVQSRVQRLGLTRGRNAGRFCNAVRGKQGTLTPLGRDTTVPSGTGCTTWWRFRCDCGKLVSKRADQVRNGAVQSCGRDCALGRAAKSDSMRKTGSPQFRVGRRVEFWSADDRLDVGKGGRWKCGTIGKVNYSKADNQARSVRIQVGANIFVVRKTARCRVPEKDGGSREVCA